MKAESIVMSAVIPAGADVIYKAWMSAKEHGAMTGSPATVVAKVGGRYTAWDGYISGTTLELAPAKRIVQSWRSTEFPSDVPDSRLEVELFPVKGGTRVTLKHSDLPTGSSAEYKKGWIDYYFTPMEEYFSGK
jgi:activator of HSP90 ATPase